MAYSAVAESFSRKAATPFKAPGFYGVPAGWTLFDQVYSDIADEVAADDVRPSALVGKLPTIAHYAPRVQRDIVAVVVRDMTRLPKDCDFLVRVRGGVYRWQFNASGKS